MTVLAEIQTFMLLAFVIGVLLGGIVMAHIIVKDNKKDEQDIKDLIEAFNGFHDAVQSLNETLSGMHVTHRQRLRLEYPKVYRAINKAVERL